MLIGVAVMESSMKFPQQTKNIPLEFFLQLWNLKSHQKVIILLIFQSVDHI
jgi:hypothetical protein